MISYIFEHNIDRRVLEKSKYILDQGGVICFPTDTNWIIAADPNNKSSIEKIYRIKKENASKHFSLLCNSISMSTKYAYISDRNFNILKNLTPGHFTFILEAQKETTKLLKASKSDKEVGIRIPPSPVTLELIKYLETPLVSTNITHEMLDLNESELIYPLLIEETIGSLIDLIIDPGDLNFVGPSTIVKLINEEFEILRHGAGIIS
jgi:tRNA threonylcarbamoyl adenosine modification protein (Sua5/YciO/YrdC/YwlC family)